MKLLQPIMPLLAGLLAACMSTGTVYARCGELANAKPGDINVIGNAFPVLHHLGKEMESCSRGALKVQYKAVPSPQNEQEILLAFGSSGASAFDAAIVSMGTFTQVQSKGQVQPLTDLVNKYRTKYKIEESMLIRVNGEVMAIAFMQNAQNLFYRKDLFDKHGLKAPANYAEMLAVARTLKEKEPSIEFPIAQMFSKGWDSATEFTNIFAGFGGKFSSPARRHPTSTVTQASRHWKP